MIQTNVKGNNFPNPFQEAASKICMNRKPKRLTTEDLKTVRGRLLNEWFPEWGFNPSEIERDELDKLAAWIAAYWKGITDPEYRPRKCLLLCGPTGRGKTMLAKMLGARFGITFFTADEVDQLYAEPEKYLAYSAKVIEGKKDIVLDDIGSEMLRSRYGNHPEFPSVLVRLYESWNYRGKLIIGTTNFSFGRGGYELFVERYGTRIAERLVEMFMTVGLSGHTNYRWLAHE